MTNFELNLKLTEAKRALELGRITLQEYTNTYNTLLQDKKSLEVDLKGVNDLYNSADYNRKFHSSPPPLLEDQFIIKNIPLYRRYWWNWNYPIEKLDFDKREAERDAVLEDAMNFYTRKADEINTELESLNSKVLETEAAMNEASNNIPKLELNVSSAELARRKSYNLSSKADVLKIQKLLNLHFNAGLKEDGLWGGNTKKAILAALRRLGIKADGIWGQDTQKAFENGYMLHANSPITGFKVDSRNANDILKQTQVSRNGGKINYSILFK